MAQEMTCEDVRDAVTRGAELDDALRAHVDGCAPCQELVADRALSTLLATSATQADHETTLELAANLDETLSRDRRGLGVLRSWSTPARQGAVAAGAAAVLVGVWLTTPRADFFDYPAARMVGVTVALAVLLLIAIRRSMRPLHLPPVTSGADAVLFAAAAALPILLAALPAAHTGHPASLGGTGAELFPRALSCFAFGLGTGAPLALITALVLRSARPSLGAVVAVLAGVGLLGNLALQLHCSLTHPGHLLLGHATVAVLALGLSAFVWRLTDRLPG